LQSGFEGIYTIYLISGFSEPDALQVIHSYLLYNYIKENIISKGKGGEQGSQDKTIAEVYSDQRLQLLANIGNFLPGILMLGNPGGTKDWDLWYQDLINFL
jgi:hypothetical protein